MDAFRPPVLPNKIELVTTDLPCRRCGYNLRGLSTALRCPECGAAVSLSERGDLLRYADPAWIALVRRGVRAKFFALVGGILVVVGSVALRRVIHPDMLRLASGCVTLLGVTGTWFVTTPDPGIRGAAAGAERARRWARATLWAGPAMQVRPVLFQGFPFPPSVRQVIFVAEMTVSLVAATCAFATLRYVAALAARAPSAAVVARARGLAWGVAATMVLLDVPPRVALALGVPLAQARPLLWVLGLSELALLVMTCVYAQLLERLGDALDDQAILARTYWAEAEGQASGGRKKETQRAP